ncbi:MAG TPA: carbohydrate kinase [Porphyromonadaceae bacterium]|nr:carbohydrate kinase [Porphyromonadaceae bacterium]
MRKVIGIGESILDIIFRNDEPQKAIPGGSVFNTLTSLQRLGVETAFISELGNDQPGKMIRKFMQDNHMSTEYIENYADRKTPVSLAFLNENNDSDFIFYKEEGNESLDVKLPIINQDDILIIGSYYSVNPSLRNRIVEILDYAKERKAIIFYDPNFRKPHAHQALRLMPTIIENFEYADIVRGSTEDFVNIYGCDESKAVYEGNIRFYCRNCICTSGSDGVKLYNGYITKQYDVEPIETVSSIGAGDTFNAGIIYGLLKNNIGLRDIQYLQEQDWDKIIKIATDLSTEVCKSYENYISNSFAEEYKNIR